jgi:hypothetical protein
MNNYIEETVFTIDGKWKGNGHFTSRFGDGTGVSETQEKEIKYYLLLSLGKEKKVIYSGGKFERIPPISDWNYDPEGDWREDMTIADAWAIATPLEQFQEENQNIDCTVLEKL